MSKYPIFIELGGRRVVVIGAGQVAVRKIQPLLAAGARIVVVAKDTDKVMTTLCQGKNIELIKSKYCKDYLAGAALAIITPGFIYQVNQFALFGLASAGFITLVMVFVDLWNFTQGELSSITPQFAGLISSLICAPLIILFIFATIEWTRFNQ